MAARLIPVYRSDGTTKRLWYYIDAATGEEAQRHGPQMSPSMMQARILASLHTEADRRGDEGGRCYFIGGEEGPVKIGFSVAPESRLAAIQSCSPVALSILALAGGGDARETAYHHQFAAHRLHGEWFERAPEILAEIERLNSLTSHQRMEVRCG